MDLQTYLMTSHELRDNACAARFAAHWTPKHVKKGARIVAQGDREGREYVLLQGCVTSCISGPDGRAICIGLYVGPCVVTPNIARTRDGISLVSLEATSDALVTQMESAALTDLMIGYEPTRNWANGVLREELSRKADREWCLAAQGGYERLAWFRERYPGHEEIFVHALIASFLGITPVTLSRLRHADGDK